MPVKKLTSFYLVSPHLYTDADSCIDDATVILESGTDLNGLTAHAEYSSLDIDDDCEGYVYEVKLVKKITKSGYKVTDI